MRLFLILALLTSVAFAGPARTKAQTAKQLGEAYTWYDGQEKRTVWLDTHSASTRSARDAGRPVFRDRAHASGRSHVPTGKMIVTFKPEWNEEQIKEWAENHGHSVEGKASWGVNVYILKASSGMEALTKSKEIHESGEVLSASPDWQRDVRTR